MDRINITYLDAGFATYLLGSFGGKLCLVDSRGKEALNGHKLQKLLNAEFYEFEDEVLKRTKKELTEYLKGDRKEFSVPFLLVGTVFQKRVWSELLKIPYGVTISYKELAKRIGSPKAYRAVANANGANHIAIIIPCHRVIASDGGIGGYTGGVEIKRELLNIEGVYL